MEMEVLHQERGGRPLRQGVAPARFRIDISPEILSTHNRLWTN